MLPAFFWSIVLSKPFLTHYKIKKYTFFSFAVTTDNNLRTRISKNRSGIKIKLDSETH